MLEDFLDAILNFSRNKTRTILSVLGVIIGVSSVIVITSLGQSSSKQIRDTFGSCTLDLVSVTQQSSTRKSRDSIQIDFDEALRSQMFGRIANIKKIWYKNSISVTLTYADVSVTSTATAIEPRYLEMCNLVLDSGEFFTVTDDIDGEQRVILGSDVASALFPDGDATGKKLLFVADRAVFSFTVSGVLKNQASGLENAKEGIYIPRGFFAKKIKPHPYASAIMVQATDPKHCVKLVEDLTAFTDEKAGTEYSVKIESMQTMINQMSSITDTLSILLSLVAGISLLVGGIGIMNIMIVTVTERRAEIGIRKALGANPLEICRQFLVESASITVLGGVTGIALGIAVSSAVEYVKSQPYAINLFAIAGAFLFSVLVGIFFGLKPAISASRLDPVEVLAG